MIKDLKINWSFGWSNDPSIMLLLDNLDFPPEETKVSVKEINNCFMYLQEREDGLASFNYYSNTEAGYAGRYFNLVMPKCTLNLKGKWKVKINDGEEIQLSNLYPTELNFKQGDIFHTTGLWSSNSSSINKHLGSNIREATITDSLETWEKGYTFYAGAFNVDKIKEYIQENRKDIEIIKVIKHYGAIYAVPRLIDNPCLHENPNANARCPDCKHKLYAEPFFLEDEPMFMEIKDFEHLKSNNELADFLVKYDLKEGSYVR